MRDSGATGTRERRSAAPLREREFRLLFAGRTVSLLGNAIAPVALAFAVLDLTGSKTDLGLILAAREIPLVVFLLAGGVWADRLPRNRVMVGANVSGLSQATVAALLIVGEAEIWQLAALAAVNGGASAFYFPASGGAVPQTVPESMLQEANALLSLTVNATQIAGAAVAGFLVAAFGSGIGIAVDAAAYLLAAMILAAMRLNVAAQAELRSFLASWQPAGASFARVRGSGQSCCSSRSSSPSSSARSMCSAPWSRRTSSAAPRRGA